MEDEAFLRLPQVTEMTTLSRSEIYRRLKNNTFPSQVRLSHKKAVWRKSEVQDWMKNPDVR